MCLSLLHCTHHAIGSLAMHAVLRVQWHQKLAMFFMLVLNVRHSSNITECFMNKEVLLVQSKGRSGLNNMPQGEGNLEHCHKKKNSQCRAFALKQLSRQPRVWLQPLLL